MKTIILSLFITLSMTTLSAQSGYGGGNRRMGMNNGMQSSESRTSNGEIEKMQKERLNKTIDKLKTDLNLDELQLIAVTNIMTDSQKTQTSIMKKKDSQDSKLLELQASNENADRQILSILNNDQVEKYKLYIEERKTRIENATGRKLRN